MRRLPVLLLFSLVVSVCTAEDLTPEKLKAWVRTYDPTAFLREMLNGMPPSERLRFLREMGNEIEQERRLSAALLLKKDIPDEAAILQTLLKDTSRVVRCAAARALYGTDAETLDLIAKHDYSTVIAAEELARSTFDSIAALPLAEQYRATRNLEALGFEAILTVRNAFQRTEPAVALTAFVVSQKDHPNVEPAWRTELRRKLEKPITHHFDGSSLEESLQTISESTGVRIRMKKKQTRDEAVNYHAKGESAENTLKVIAMMTTRAMEYEGGEVVFAGSTNIVCGSLDVWLYDFRDWNSPEQKKEIEAVVGKSSAWFTKMYTWNGFVIAEQLPLGMSGRVFEKAFEELRSSKLKTKE